MQRQQAAEPGEQRDEHQGDDSDDGQDQGRCPDSRHHHEQQRSPEEDGQEQHAPGAGRLFEQRIVGGSCCGPGCVCTALATLQHVGEQAVHHGDCHGRSAYPAEGGVGHALGAGIARGAGVHETTCEDQEGRRQRQQGADTQIERRNGERQFNLRCGIRLNVAVSVLHVPGGADGRVEGVVREVLQFKKSIHQEATEQSR